MGIIILNLILKNKNSKMSHLMQLHISAAEWCQIPATNFADGLRDGTIAIDAPQFVGESSFCPNVLSETCVVKNKFTHQTAHYKCLESNMKKVGLVLLI